MSYFIDQIPNTWPAAILAIMALTMLVIALWEQLLIIAIYIVVNWALLSLPFIGWIVALILNYFFIEALIEVARRGH